MPPRGNVLPAQNEIASRSFRVYIGTIHAPDRAGLEESVQRLLEVSTTLVKCLIGFEVGEETHKSISSSSFGSKVQSLQNELSNHSGSWMITATRSTDTEDGWIFVGTSLENPNETGFSIA